MSKIYFTDLSGFKVRPVLIVKEYKDEDVLFLPLTTNRELGGVVITEHDLETGGLKKPSVVIIPKIGIIHKDFLIRELGTLKREVMQNIQNEVCKNLGCSARQ